MDIDESQPTGVLPTEVIAENLYASSKGIVWVLSVKRRKGPKTTFTAFAVEKSGLLMTCAQFHSSDWSKVQIRARPLTDRTRGFVFNVESLYSFSNCDIIILKLKDGAEVNQVAVFGSGELDVGDGVTLIGHANYFVGSGNQGSVLYPCESNVKFDIESGSTTCEFYKSRALKYTPKYRVMGDAWNLDDFERERTMLLPGQQSSLVFEKGLLAGLPIIQCSGLVGGDGTPGGPVFNSNGEVVGMFVNQSVHGYDVVVHVSALTKVLAMVMDSISSTKKSSEKDKKNYKSFEMPV